TASGTERLSIGVQNGQIMAFLDPAADWKAARTIDASGLVVMPGAVDAHVHFREPGLAHKEGFATGTRAAAAGGVTTAMVMPTDQPWTLTPQDFQEKQALISGQAHVDVALQAAVAADLSNIDAFEELAEMG